MSIYFRNTKKIATKPKVVVLVLMCGTGVFALWFQFDYFSIHLFIIIYFIYLFLEYFESKAIRRINLFGFGRKQRQKKLTRKSRCTQPIAVHR